jgi:hypothetical protein
MNSRHWENQPRAPQGTEIGGQWIKAGEAARRAAGLSNLIQLERFPMKGSGGKAVLSDGKILSYNDPEFGETVHLQVYTRMVLDNPDQFDEALVKEARALKEENRWDDGRFEAIVMEKTDSASVSINFMNSLQLVKAPTARYPSEMEVNRFVRSMIWEIERGRLIPPENGADSVQFHYGNVYISIPKNSLGMFQRVTIDQWNKALVHYE